MRLQPYIQRVLLVTVLLSVGASLMTACTPAYTADTTKRYARELGFTERYQIERWHNRQFARDNRILVNLSADTDLDHAAITQAVAKHLSARFAAVDPLLQHHGVEPAREKALQRQYQFLLDINRVAWTSPPPPQASTVQAQPAGHNPAPVPASPPPQTSEPEQEAEDRLASIEVEMRLIDVVSNTTVDKFLIVAAPSWTRERGGTIEQVLGAAVDQLGVDLTGY